MDVLSSHWFTIMLAFTSIALAIASFIYKDRTLALCSVWFVAEIASDWITTGFSKYATAEEFASYMYLFASTSVLFSIFIIKNRNLFSKSLLSIMLIICLLSVPFGGYHYFVQSNWDSWGSEHYWAISIWVDWIYSITIVGLEALMILLGVYSAMASSRSHDGVSFKR